MTNKNIKSLLEHRHGDKYYHITKSRYIDRCHLRGKVSDRDQLLFARWCYLYFKSLPKNHPAKQ